MEIEQICQYQTNSTPWIEKYRPNSMRDLISHQQIIATLTKFTEDGKSIPNLLFYGPPGTGKTSTILALAKQIYGSNFKSMVIHLNASDDRGINVVRETIKNFVSTGSLSFQQTNKKQLKLVVLDEADSMTQTAQFALRRIIEKYSGQVRFCLICNYVSKIIVALQSRCNRFKFKNIQFDDCYDRIKEIMDAERMVYGNEAIQTIYDICEGDMRRIVNMLQNLKLTGKELTIDFIYDHTGNVNQKDIKNLFVSLMNNTIQEVYQGNMEYIQEFQQVQQVKSIPLQVIIKCLNLELMNVDLNSRMKEFTVNRLSDLEYRLSINCSEKTQTLALISAFVEIRHTNK